VDQLREVIRSGRLADGDRLPNERELAEAFAVSRSTLREALRMLEAVGVLRVRAGAGGGIFVSEPGELELARALEPILHFHEATKDEVLEYVVNVLTDAAYWAAVRCDPAALSSIERAHAALLDALNTAAPWRSTATNEHIALLDAI